MDKQTRIAIRELNRRVDYLNMFNSNLITTILKWMPVQTKTTKTTDKLQDDLMNCYRGTY